KSGGSTICGNSGARVCVRSTTRMRPLERPAAKSVSVLVAISVMPSVESVNDAAYGGATADEQRLSGDEIRLGRGKEEHRARHVRRPAESPHRDRLDDSRQLGAVLRDQVFEDLCFADRSGRNDVDRDAARPESEGPGTAGTQAGRLG